MPRSSASRRPPPPSPGDDDHDDHEPDHHDDDDDDDGARDEPQDRPATRGGHRHHHHRHKREHRVRIMEASGQTDADRRELRRAQRALQREILQSDAGDAIEEPTSGAFEKVVGENNELFEKVRYTREAVLDGENVDLISGRAARQVDRLVQVPRYDAVRLSQKIRMKCRLGATGNIDWKNLGNQAGACFNAVPSCVSFLLGPIDVHYEPKERTKRVPRVRHAEDDAEEEKPEEVEQKDKDRDSADKLSAVERHIKVINKTLSKRCREEDMKSQARLAEREETEGPLPEEEKRREVKRIKRHGAEVPAVNYLFNPRSFTQTVENIFHFSFLVKQGRASLQVRSKEESEKYGGAAPGPVVKVCHQQAEMPPHRQAIVSLNMKDWRDLCNAYKVEKGDVPHRTGSKHARTHAVSSPSPSRRNR